MGILRIARSFVATCSFLILRAAAQTISTTTIDTGATGDDDTGQYTTQAIVAGNPAAAYYDATKHILMFIRNSNASGTGTWARTIVDSHKDDGPLGDVGQYSSLAIVNGNPAISYYDAFNHVLKFAHNSAADGSGAWTIATVDTNTDVGQYSSLAVVGGKPAISYYDKTKTHLKFARNSTADGTGTWILTTIDATANVGLHTSLAIVNGNPAISYDAAGHLKFARNGAADGSGVWSFSTADGANGVGFYTSLTTVNGNPAISYLGAGNLLKFARNSTSTGSGTWTIANVATLSGVGSTFTSLTIVNGSPAISFYDNSLKFARNSAADGSGTWTVTTADSSVADVGRFTSLVIVNGNPAITYYDGTNGALKFARNSAADGSGSWTATTVDTGVGTQIVGLFTSQAIVAGNPAITYNDTDMTGPFGRLRFARNSAPDGSGTWTFATIDSTGGEAFEFPSVAIVNGAPAITYYHTAGGTKFARNSAADGTGAWTVNSPLNIGTGPRSSLATVNGNPGFTYYDSSLHNLHFARNSAADGSGTWNDTTVDAAADTGQYASLAVVNGVPAAAYYDASNGDLKFARGSDVNGAGPWIISTIDNSVNDVGQYPCLVIANGNPGVSYYDATNGYLKFARNSAADGSGNWAISTVDSTGDVGVFNSLAIILGYPAVSYYDKSNGDLKFARNTAADGSGTWIVTTVDSIGNVGQYSSLVALPNANAAISYYDADNGDLKWATLDFPADMAVEEPSGSNILNNGSRIVTIPIGMTASLTFTIKNVGNHNLTGLAVTKDGTNASDFTVTSNPTSPVAGPNGSTTFVIRFAPTTSGTKIAAIHIASNDPVKNPFNINLTGNALSSANDTDGDGLNDVAEFELAALGFDWQVAQPALVNTYYSNANGAGLYTESQLQALYVNDPIIGKDEATGQFKLTIAIEKSTDLVHFGPFPMNSSQTVINAQGELEFQFSVPDNTAFFLLEVR